MVMTDKPQSMKERIEMALAKGNSDYYKETYHLKPSDDPEGLMEPDYEARPKLYQKQRQYVLEALLDPTPEMLDAMETAFRDPQYGLKHYHNLWRGVLQAAIKKAMEADHNDS